MCTQELIWCSCGHGEFLPIVTCARGEFLKSCWIIVHGQHHITMPSRCSYCQNGFNERLLLPPAKPQPGSLLAQKVGTNADPVLQDLLKDPDSWPDDGEKVIANLDVKYDGTSFAELTGEDESLPMGMGDVLNCDFAGFDLDQELKEGP